ncbi:BadF/BadG/BcrA/BcrD ATPase family protein [Paenibacillus sp. OV219]|uniref:BadF/BadG/BcrA/BcrD ATPase family protein n=1 Tax=Paenibacillus sp. OV219 TaxID=1884377 RepID=UPI0008B55651|nr:BadF/BadG/BcrA/BcrD ATPase family protein [Paenibacillus sp. OV219]SEM85307.1 glucosamine kinase [Paenibacillus sp. OV219]
MTRNVVIGIDGGGTTTRLLAANLNGDVLAYVEEGCCNPGKDPHAKQHVQNGINRILTAANVGLDQVIAIAAGFAGLDRVEDHEWAADFLNIDGLDCSKVIVNDAVVAHSGALMNKPGIVDISGTGSIIFAINEAGRQIRNYDFRHYAPTASRFLAFDAVYEIIAGNGVAEDEPFVQEVLHFWGIDDVAALSKFGSNGFIADDVELTLRFGLMGPLVTAAAASGSPLARKVCDNGVQALDTGIRLLGSCFEAESINVAFIGSVIRDDYVRTQLTHALERISNRTYHVVEPVLPPAAGAVLLAMEAVGQTADEKMVNNLRQ